jgi:hypothetical protein
MFQKLISAFFVQHSVRFEADGVHASQSEIYAYIQHIS